jgi:hypothetical protein
MDELSFDIAAHSPGGAWGGGAAISDGGEKVAKVVFIRLAAILPKFRKTVVDPTAVNHERRFTRAGKEHRDLRCDCGTAFMGQSPIRIEPHGHGETVVSEMITRGGGGYCRVWVYRHKRYPAWSELGL